MRRDEALDLLARMRPALAELGVTQIALFGSVARDEAGPASDVDVLIDLEAADRYHAYLNVRDRLEAAFGRPVDVVMRGALKPRARTAIEAEAVRVP